MCLVPTQMFSKFHPEYDFVYNWEADVRFLGNYKELFKNAQGETTMRHLQEVFLFS
jgi:hypothetical protein